MEKIVRVLIVDDHDLLRTGLVSFLQTQPDIEIVGDINSGRRAIELFETTQPDVVIMDITMPEMDGMEATRQLKSKFPECQVLVLTVHEDKEYLFEMLTAGASGYLTKEAASEELVNAIHSVAQGQVYLQPTLARWLLDDYNRLIQTGIKDATAISNQDTHAHQDLEVLSKRELQVLELVAQGKTSNQIGEELGISTNTVFRHRERIMHKLNLRNASDLTRFAIRTGLIEP